MLKLLNYSKFKHFLDIRNVSMWFSNCKNGSARTNVILQYVAVFVASITLVGSGCSISWTSPALPYLTSKNSKFPVTANQGAWIASLTNPGSILGYVLNASIIDKLGTKNTLLVLSIPQITACILIVIAENWMILCVSRFLLGIGYGAGMCAATSYLAEVGDEKTRGIFLVMVKLSLNIGIFFVMLLGACVSYNQMNLLLLLLPLVFIFIFPFMPDSTNFKKRGESSLFSIKKGKEEETLLGNEENQETLGMKIVEEPIINIGVRLRNLFTGKNNQRAFIIVSLIFMTEALSGHAAVMAFTEEILDYSEYSLSAEYATLVVAAMKIVASILSTQIIERIDRKTLFLSSGILAIISQAIVGIFFWVKFHTKMDVSSMNWIPLFGITVYEMVGNTGIGNMGFVYSGELFSTDVKGIGITLTNISFDLAAFLVKLQFRVVVNNLGIASAFFSFAICCAIGTGTVLYLAPETRNKSLKEIQEIMDSGKKKKKRESENFVNKVFMKRQF